MTITTNVIDGVATVVIDRPPVNALDREAFVALTETFRSFADRRDANVVVLTAVGERAFCAGVDFADATRRHDAAGDATESPSYQLDTGRLPRDCFAAIRSCPLPVIGAVNGPAVGAGLVLACVCDVLFAAEGTTFALTEINVGLLGAGRHLQRMVGPYKARRMYFTGEPVPAAELYRLGAVEEVVPRDRLLPTATALAGEIAAKSPIALRLAKEAFNRVEFLPLEEGYRTEQDYTTRLSRFADAQEARTAQVEKRPPSWSWR